MSANAAIGGRAVETCTAIDVARELGPILARHANEATDEDKFVTENFELLRSSGLVEAGVPDELGGAGAKIDELATMLRTLGYHCGSTALAFSMHTHQVAIPAWRWMHQKAVAVEPLLKRVAKERILLLTSGGSDWIAGSGKAEKVHGGYRITARKTFSSGAPFGDLLMTSAVFEDRGEPPVVLHFEIPMKSQHVKIMDTWHTLGMRGTGSHDVLIDGYIVPETAVTVRREAGKWHPLFQVIATIAFPLVYSVYLGVAESARDIAVTLAKKKAVDAPRCGACGTHGHGADRRSSCARFDAGGSSPQRSVGRYYQSSDDRQATRYPTCDGDCGPSHGACRQCRLLPGGRSRTAVPRYAGRALSSATIRPTGGIRRRYGARIDD